VPRIVSLVPSVTETLLAWSIHPIAVTRFCEHPELTSVGGTKDPDVAAIVAMRPDLVIVDREENRAEDADSLLAAGVQLHVLHVRSLADVAPAVSSLAAAVGIAAHRRPPVTAGTDGRRASTICSTPPPRALIPIWRRPWMSINGDTYGSSLLDAAGVTNVLASEEVTYPTIELDEVASLRPDVVLAPSEPYPFSERHRLELETVGPVVFVDGKDLFWWGARTPGALERLRRMVRELPSLRPPVA
jgi:ABC-type Fe3+-hydroxamate transport system substrate-binding protein